MSLSAPPPSTGASAPPGDGPTDAQLLRANTPASVSELTDRYCRRAHRMARATLGAGDAATRAVEGAERALAGRPPSRPPEPGAVGPAFLGAVARRSVAARGPTHRGAGPLAGLSDRECAVVGLAIYGRLSVRSIAVELGLSARAVAAEMDAGVRRLAGAHDGGVQRGG